MFPKKAKDAAKELKELGAEVALVDDRLFSAPVFEPKLSARIDRTMRLAVFDSLREDPAFVALTAGADGKLPIPMKGMNGSRENR